MCGRYTLSAPPKAIARLFDLGELPELRPRYNIAPTQDVAAVTASGPDKARQLRWFRWGLIPHWANDADIGSRLINARSETAAEKPAFRSAMRRRRCLVVADGFYEWQRTDSGKQPIHVRMDDGRPFALAALWERWEGGEEGPVESAAILTTEPNELLRPIHNRMPVIVEPGRFDLWLDPDARDVTRLGALLRPYRGADLVCHPVSRIVNNPAHDSPRCVQPLR
jgi:putative SOS response-associated peptidase YedK